MTSQLPRFRSLFAAGSWEKGTKNRAAVRPLRSFLFHDYFSSVQDLPKVGLLLPNVVKIFIVLLDEGPKLGLLLPNVVKTALIFAREWFNSMETIFTLRPSLRTIAIRFLMSMWRTAHITAHSSIKRKSDYISKERGKLKPRQRVSCERFSACKAGYGNTGCGVLKRGVRN